MNKRRMANTTIPVTAANWRVLKSLNSLAGLRQLSTRGDACFHFITQSAGEKVTAVRCGTCNKSLSRKHSILGHESDPLHARVMRLINHLRDILEIHISIAAHECDLVDSRQIDARQP